MREDRGSTTPEDAAAWERMRGADDWDDPRPTLAEAIRDEADECTCYWTEAGAYELPRREPEPRPCPECERPTLAEATRDECAHLHQSDVADLDDWPPPAAIWVCDDCGAVCDER